MLTGLAELVNSTKPNLILRWRSDLAPGRTHCLEMYRSCSLPTRLTSREDAALGGVYRLEASILRFDEFIRSECLQLVSLPQVVFFDESRQLGELCRIIAVIDLHAPAIPHESMVFEPFQTTHSVASGVQPVSTSEPQFGQVAISICPTMNVNSHSGHCNFGDGVSGAGGGGGV